MPDLYNSGTIGHGSMVLTIETVAYIAENITPNDAANRTDRNDEKGNHSGFVMTQGPVTGSATLQLETASTAIPEKGDTFKADFFRKDTEATYIIESVSPAFAQGETHKVSITFVKDPAIAETPVA